MKIKRNKIYHGNAIDILKTFETGSVDCIVTSSPYWNLRKYGSDEYAPFWITDENCEHVWEEYYISGKTGGKNKSKQTIKGTNNYSTFKDSKIKECLKCGSMQCELGQEPSPDLFVEHLSVVLDECKRVLKKTGTLWLNIGDTYSGSGGRRIITDNDFIKSKYKNKIPKQSLVGIPQRLMLKLIDKGWIMRNDIIWKKTNPMPNPCKTRLTSSHEHIFNFGFFPFFSQKRKYYYKQLLEPLKHPSVKGAEFGGNKAKDYGNKVYSGRTYDATEIIGKNMRDVIVFEDIEIWNFSTAGYKGAHYAVFPIELPRRAIEAGCPKEVCENCGKPVRIIYSKGTPIEEWKKQCGGPEYHGKGVKDYEGNSVQNPSDVKRNILSSLTTKIETRIECGCGNSKYVKGLVLDPFMGSGTTAIAAIENEVDYIGIELFEKNIELSTKRIEDKYPCSDDILLEV